MTRNLALALVVGLLLIAGLAGWAIVNTVQGIAAGPATVTGGLATQVQQFMHPTPTIYPDPVTVVQQVRSLSRLETAQYTIEKVITAETGQGALGALFGDRLIFVAHGQVIAGVDLSKLRGSDVVVSPAGEVTIIMPAAEIFVTSLDNNKSYVYDRQTGLLTKGDQNLETQARQVAQQQIEQGALEDGILKLAQDNAASYLERLLRSLGFKSVVFVQATPEAASMPALQITPASP
jgi:Protein of unknown function (DUF4230)